MGALTFQLILLLFWGLVQTTAVSIIMLLLFVYKPLLKDNVVALLLSIGIVVVISIIDLVRIWKDFTADGFNLLIILCIFLSIAVITNVFHAIGGMYVCFSE